MSTRPITAEELRALHEIRKQKDLRNTVNLIANEFVIPAAESGETSILVKQDDYQPRYPYIRYTVRSPPPFAELVEALQSNFPNVTIVPGSDTIVNEAGIFVKKTHILFDWSVASQPPSGKGCREMSKCFTHGQRIRHYMPKDGSIFSATYDAYQDKLVLSDGKAFESPCSFANEHYRRLAHPHRYRDGWGECECEVNGKWVSTYSLPG